MSTELLQYEVFLHNPEEHIFRVRLTISGCRNVPYTLRMPAWIPGSYMVRDFSKNIMRITSRVDDVELPLTLLDKQSWQGTPNGDCWVLEYDIYAWEASVRTAHFDTTHAYFNGTSLFLAVEHCEQLPVTVIVHPADRDYVNSWRVASSMRSESGKWAFGRFYADNYEDLIDHPFEIGDFQNVTFEVDGVTHDMVFSGHFKADLPLIAADVKTICETHVSMFEALPIDRYMFLVWVVESGYGGLEHKYSTSLIVSRDDLILHKGKKQNPAYQQFLGLCSHEYFHLWNVKRIRPLVFQQSGLTEEVYTRLLWVFEGFTSYYDDLALLRAGLIDEATYFEMLASTITRVEKGSGRHLQSVAESSFYTWTKFYKQDENAANAIVSYYAKGALIALVLDLTLRDKSSTSLDDVMRFLWQTYGKRNQGIDETAMASVLASVSGHDFSSFIRDYVEDVKPLPLEESLKTIDIALRFALPSKYDDKGAYNIEATEPSYIELGMRWKTVSQGLEVMAVMHDLPAAKAGLSKGDIIIAIDHRMVTEETIKSLARYYALGDTITISYFRGKYLYSTSVVLAESMANVAILSSLNSDSVKRSHWALGSSK